MGVAPLCSCHALRQHRGRGSASGLVSGSRVMKDKSASRLAFLEGSVQSAERGVQVHGHCSCEPWSSSAVGLMPRSLLRLPKAFSSGCFQHLTECRASTCVAREQSCHFEAARSLLCETVASVGRPAVQCGSLKPVMFASSVVFVPTRCVVLSVVRMPRISHMQGSETCSASWVPGSATAAPCGARSASLDVFCRVTVSSECIGLAKSLQKVVSKYLLV